MSLIDIIILIVVVFVLSLIIYFRWIKKDHKGLNCHCYKRKSCALKIEELKNLLQNKTNNEAK